MSSRTVHHRNTPVHLKKKKNEPHRGQNAAATCCPIIKKNKTTVSGLSSKLEIYTFLDAAVKYPVEYSSQMVSTGQMGSVCMGA